MEGNGWCGLFYCFCRWTFSAESLTYFLFWRTSCWRVLLLFCWKACTSCFSILLFCPLWLSSPGRLFARQLRRYFSLCGFSLVGSDIWTARTKEYNNLQTQSDPLYCFYFIIFIKTYQLSNSIWSINLSYVPPTKSPYPDCAILLSWLHRFIWPSGNP